MVMKTTSGTPAARRSWADIVKKSASETATESLPALDEETESSEIQEQPADAKEEETVAEVATSSEALQESAIVPAPVVTPKTPPGILEATSTEASDVSSSLTPGTRGGLQCLCRGKVLNMLSHYGWIAAFGKIDHPLAGKHFGRVYVHSKDIVEGHALAQGDTVSFYLYVDEVGLGAEACRVVPTEADVAPLPKLRADAAVFVPGGAFTSAPTAPVSDMFVRMSRAFESIPANGYVQMAGAINFACFDSDSSSEEGDDGDADAESLYDDSDHSCPEVSHVVQKVKYEAPTSSAPSKGTCVAWPDDRAISPGMTSDSTNAGTTSDSETEGKVTLQAMLRSPPPGLGFHGIHIPPGLRPPPGLEDIVPFSVC